MSAIAETHQLTQEMLPKLKMWLARRASEILAREAAGSRDVQRLRDALQQAMEESEADLSEQQRDALIESLAREMLGFGPIQPLLDDPTITEVMINGAHCIFVERNGRIEASEVAFDDDSQVIELAEKIVLPLGRRIDADSPTVDARLPDGSRVNVVVPPIALDGPVVTIRKFAGSHLKVEDLVGNGTMTEAMVEYLEACVGARLNIVVSGGTGSGKTTLLNIISSFIPSHERIVTIEDSAELKLHQDHVVRMEGRPANVDGAGEVTIRHLVRNSLRMRPERIVVGEVRGGEALDMLQAMNTGHDGSMTTLHANSPRDAIARLETLVLMAGLELPVVAIRKQIASAVDLIIQKSRLSDGSRKITSISEVVGMEGDIVVLSEVFKFERQGTDAEGKVLGRIVPTGIRPMFDKKLEDAGFKLGAHVFSTAGKQVLPQGGRQGPRR